jgi:lysophospholipase L1-like esterase
MLLLTVLVLILSLAFYVGKQVNDRKIAADLDLKITALGDINSLTLNKSPDVEAVRTTYDSLTSDEKEYVTKLDVLKAAENRIYLIEKGAKIDEKIMAIKALDQITLNDAPSVAEVRSAYDSLNDTEKTFVTNLDVLKAAENRIYLIEKGAQVDKKIMAIKALDQLTLNDASSVAEVRSAYDSLNETEKAFVTKLDALKAAENRIYLIAKGAQVDEKIMAIKPLDQLTLNDASSVTKVRSAYDSLNDIEKAFVTKLDVLKAAENQLYLLAKASQKTSSWSGKTIVTYGDSITWYDGQSYIPSTLEPGVTVVGYQSYIRERLNAKVINRGISGYTTPEINRYIQSTSLTGVYAVTILAGTNDFRLMTSESVGEILPKGSSFNGSTFIGAYQQAIEYILNNYPGTKIYLFTPIQAWTDSFGLMPETYPQAVIRLGELYSLPVCDLYHESGINESTKSIYIVDSDAVPYDFHPSTAGYSKMADVIVPFLKNNY